MGMQHRSGPARPDYGQVKTRLGRGPPRSGHDGAVPVDLEDVARGERALVHAARGDREAEGLAADYRAEVPAGAERPPSGVTLARNIGEVGGQLGERHGDFGP
jgi:hypothetical protein